MTTVRHIRLRRDTAANWSLVNPVLQSGETGIEIDTRLMKVGDGSTSWAYLPYFNITPRVVNLADSRSITIDVSTGDIFHQTNTQNVGSLNVGNPIGAQFDGQKIMLRIRSNTVQSLTFGTNFVGSVDIPLPTVTSGSGKTDLLGFMFNNTAGKWNLIAANFGF